MENITCGCELHGPCVSQDLLEEELQYARKAINDRILDGSIEPDKHWATVAAVLLRLISVARNRNNGMMQDKIYALSRRDTLEVAEIAANVIPSTPPPSDEWKNGFFAGVDASIKGIRSVKQADELRKSK